MFFSFSEVVCTRAGCFPLRELLKHRGRAAPKSTIRTLLSPFEREGMVMKSCKDYPPEGEFGHYDVDLSRLSVGDADTYTGALAAVATLWPPCGHPQEHQKGL